MATTKHTESRRTPLSKAEKDAFFTRHLPYRIAMLLALRDKMIGNEPMTKQFSICAFESALISSRVFMEFLGLGIGSGPDYALVERQKYHVDGDEVKVVDLGGSFAQISELATPERELLSLAYREAHKSTAHFTHGPGRGFAPTQIFGVVNIVAGLLEKHLYGPTHREMRIVPDTPMAECIGATVGEQ